MVQLAEVNAARLRFALGAPEVAEFIAAIDKINALAEQSPGFCWRMVDDRPRLRLVTVSVWVDYASLHAFTYRSAHGEFVRRRAEWFEKSDEPASAMWWIEDGRWPARHQALRRLRHLRDNGPSPHAFSARHRFTPDGQPEP